MGFSAISEVGNQIVSILNKELVPDVILHTGTIGLCSPNDHGDFAIGVYLYDISSNEDIMETGMINSDVRQQTYPSSFLTLHYMITAYSSGDLKFRSEEDHRILGKVVQALSDHSVIGQTSGLHSAPMRTRIELERIEPYDKIRLWTFPNEPYRLSLFYRVQPVEITSAKTRPVTRVRDLSIFIGEEDLTNAGAPQRGNVWDEDVVWYSQTLVVLCIDKETGRPVTGSNVRVFIDGAKPPVIKEDGYRIFLNVTEKQFTVRCESGIYEPQEVEVDLNEWDESQVLTIELTPGQAYPRND